MFNKLASGLWSGFIEQKLPLGCSLKCDQIHYNNSYEFDHTLFCCLSPTWMLHKPASASKLKIRPNKQMKFKISVTSHFFWLHFLEPKTITFWSLFLHFTNHCFLELWRNDFLTLHAKVVLRKVGHLAHRDRSSLHRHLKIIDCLRPALFAY